MKIEEYVNIGLKNKSLVPFSAEKIEKVLARMGIEGEEIISWQMDENGNEIKSSSVIVTKDNETGIPDWVLTSSDSEGNPLLDKNGHYYLKVMKDKIFKEIYYPDSNIDMLFLPKNDIQLFVRVLEDIKLIQDEKEINILKNDLINITDDNNIYHVPKSKFNIIYKRMDNIDNFYE